MEGISDGWRQVWNLLAGGIFSSSAGADLALLPSQKSWEAASASSSEFGSSHLVNADSREGITIRNHMLNELMRWLPGSRADTFLDPDLLNYFVHDQSQTEPGKYINATKEEENVVVDVLNEAVRLTTFSSYFNVNKYIISVDLEEGRKVFAALISPNSSAHH